MENVSMSISINYSIILLLVKPNQSIDYITRARSSSLIKFEFN